MKYSEKTLEYIARALARPWARPLALEFVVERYRRTPTVSHVSQKDGLAVAISQMARPTDLATLIDLIQESSHGHTRIFFVRNLARSRSEMAVEALQGLVNDPDLKKEIGVVLKRRHSRRRGQGDRRH